MSAEIICIGTELLLGDILNSNSQYLAIELARLGIPHFYQSVVGDNVERIHEVIRLAVSRSQILIFTGGLGPTPDDLTTETIASFFDTPLENKPELVADIKRKFASRNRQMSENNLKQALIPQGAEILPNLSGTAPGIIWQPFKEVENHPQQKLTIFTFPGVPAEMKQMWRDTAVTFLKSQGWGQEIIYSRMMRFRGIGESNLAQKVNHLFDLTNPTVAPYASKGEVRLRIAAKTKTPELAEELINPVAEEIKAIAGDSYFGDNEDTIASVVGQLLMEKEQTISVAESCTGGGLGAMLTETPGSSAYFCGGVIAYSNRIKIAQLGVSDRTLEEHGAVSPQVAQEMAIGVQKLMNTDWTISITGVAGPGGGTETKPVGLVYVGVANPKGEATSYEFKFGEKRNRDIIRYLSASYALDKLRRQIMTF